MPYAKSIERVCKHTVVDKKQGNQDLAISTDCTVLFQQLWGKPLGKRWDLYLNPKVNSSAPSFLT